MGQATSKTRSGGLPTPGVVPPAPVGPPLTLPAPQITEKSAEAAGSTKIPQVQGLAPSGTPFVSAQHKPSKGSKQADDTEPPILWTQSYQPEGTDEGLWDNPTPDTDEEELEKDTHVKLEELIERTAGDFKTRGELFERCGYDVATILEAVKAGVQEYKTQEQECEEPDPFWRSSGRTPAVGSQAPLSTFSVGQSQAEGGASSDQAQGFSTGAVTGGSVPILAGVPTGNDEEEEEMPDDEEWASRILSAPYFPGDLMGDLEEFTESPLEMYEKLWTRQTEGCDEFIDYVIENVVSEGPGFVFDDTESEASDTEDDSNGDSEENMSTNGSEAEADKEEEEEYEDDEEEDEMKGVERLDDEAYARLIGSVRKVPPVASEGSAGQKAHTPSLAQGGPQSMAVDAAMDEVSTSAMDEGAITEVGPSAVTAAFASESPTSQHSQSSKSSADQTPTPPRPASAAPSPSSGQKRAREEEVEGQQDKVRKAMLGMPPRRYSDSEEEERRLDPLEAATHVRHKMEVLKLIMGATRNLDQKALRQLQAELKLLTQCDTWLDSLESEAGPSGGGHESRMLLDCLDLAIRDVSVLRRLDVDKAVYRAEEVLTEREIAEEQTDEAMEEPVLDRIDIKALVQEMSQGYRTDMPIQPEAFAIMQEACEAYATKLFKTANRMAKLQGRDHLKAGDLWFIQSLDHQL